RRSRPWPAPYPSGCVVRPGVRSQRHGVTLARPASTPDMRPAEPTSDAALLAVASHDPAAFEVLYLRYVRRVTAFAAKRCASADDVADVVAQTFFRLIGAAERYEPDRADVAPFVFGIAANVIRELHRGRSRSRALVAKLSGRDLL